MKTLNQVRDEILGIINNNPDMTRMEMFKELPVFFNVSWQTFKRIIDILKEEEIVVDGEKLGTLMVQDKPVVEKQLWDL